jgi:molecular chaperone IbpA
MSISNFNNDERDNLLEKLKKRPDLVGLQYTLEQLEKFVKFTNEQNYPPTTIEKTDDNIIIIYLALAGFAKNQLNITLNNGELIVKGEKEKEEKDVFYIQKGIAFRSFEKKFLIGPEGKILKAFYKNGLLQLKVYLPIPKINETSTNIYIEDEEKE